MHVGKFFWTYLEIVHTFKLQSLDAGKAAFHFNIINAPFTVNSVQTYLTTTWKTNILGQG